MHPGFSAAAAFSQGVASYTKIKFDSTGLVPYVAFCDEVGARAGGGDAGGDAGGGATVVVVAPVLPEWPGMGRCTQ